MPPTAIPQREVVYAPGEATLSASSGFLWTWRVCFYGALALAMWIGGAAVGIAALGAALAAPWGDRGGAVRWLFRLGGGIVGAALAWHWYHSAALALSYWVHVPLPLAALGSFGGITLATAMLASRFARPLTRRIATRRYARVVNHVLGGIFGGAEGAVVALVLMCVLLLAGPGLGTYATALRHRHPTLALQVDRLNNLRCWLARDDGGRWLARNNPLPRVPELGALVAASDVWVEPWRFWDRVAADDVAELRALLRDPAVRAHCDAVRNDPALRKALRDHDLATVLNSPQYRAALVDDAFCRALATTWPRVRASIQAAELEHARVAARNTLDPGAQQKLDRAVQRAAEFDVQLP